jgi:ribosomal protein S18 acetylase RimI-like enzyme
MIERSTKADLSRSIDTVVLAFANDPFVRWLFPEPGEFLKSFPTLAQLFGGRAFEHDCAYHLEGYLGSALWLPPGVHPDEEGIMSLLEGSLSGTILSDAVSVFEQMDHFHPAEPCWHLAFIVVDPARQGRGLGTRLLEQTLKVCDEEGKVAYLESTNPANLSLYVRHGFEVMGQMQAGKSPPLFPMARQPR